MNDRGRVAAAEALGVTYRTMAACHKCRCGLLGWSHNDKHGDGGDEQDYDAGDSTEKVVALEERVRALEAENQALRETIETQAKRMVELERMVGAR